MCFNFAKVAPRIKVQTFFYWRSCFLEFFILFGPVRGNLGKNGAWNASQFEKMRPTWTEMQSFFLEGGHFFWGSFFRASLGKFGPKSFAPPKICLLLRVCQEQDLLVLFFQILGVTYAYKRNRERHHPLHKHEKCQKSRFSTCLHPTNHSDASSRSKTD